MSYKKTILTSFALVLPMLQSEASFAFSINGPGFQRYAVPFIDYNAGITGVVKLDAWPYRDPRRFLTGQVLEVKMGGTDRLRALLKQSFPTWDFSQTGNLHGDFDIDQYYACTPNYPVPITGGCGGLVNSKVGANFLLYYNPNPAGRDPMGSTVHWIQRVITNYNPAEPGKQKDYDMLDIDFGQSDPYYDSDGTAEPNYFWDVPVAKYYSVNRYVYAETYLVEEIAPKTVKIYNGVRWGWESKVMPLEGTKKISDSLSAGETDRFTFNDLTPGANFLAWIDNDLPQNRCNPNTVLSDSGNYDDDSSFLGDGLASAFTGKVSSNGKIDLNVYSNGQRGEDSGNYDLYVKVYDPDESPDLELLGGSGGGGILPRPKGRTQNDPILANQKNGDWQIFRNVPSCRWYDPHTPYGFEFQALDDTLFTEIVDFPVSADEIYSVAVDGTILGQFGAGQNVDFVKLFGKGISNFTITGINSFIGSTPETAFPIQLAFDRNRGSFQMRPFDKPKSVPEPTAVFGLLTLAFLGFSGSKPKR